MQRSQVTLEWEARGEKQGQILKARSYLLRSIRSAFGPNVATDISQAVENQSDLSTLDRWFEQVLSADSVEEVRSALGLPPSA